MLVHHRVTPSIKFAGTHLYSWVERGTVRVKCLAQEHNKMSPARARTRTTCSAVEHTNHEATVPPPYTLSVFISVVLDHLTSVIPSYSSQCDSCHLPITLESTVKNLAVAFGPDSQPTLLIQDSTVHCRGILQKLKLSFSRNKFPSSLHFGT